MIQIFAICLALVSVFCSVIFIHLLSYIYTYLAPMVNHHRVLLCCFLHTTGTFINNVGVSLLSCACLFMLVLHLFIFRAPKAPMNKELVQVRSHSGATHQENRRKKLPQMMNNKNQKEGAQNLNAGQAIRRGTSVSMIVSPRLL